MERNLTLKILDEEFTFDHRRIIYWSRKKMIIAADLHWGKTQFLRTHGIAISDDVLDADLKRLGSVIEDYQAESLLVLGDLVHHERALSRGIIEKIALFRHTFPCELILVKGNHDRFTKFPESWGVVEESSFHQHEFAFHHEFSKDEKSFQFSGHIHPMMKLRAGHDVMRIPAFILSPKQCLLPAFSRLTGGQDLKLQKDEKAVLILDDRVELLAKD